jgi:hypothetical protein
MDQMEENHLRNATGGAAAGTAVNPPGSGQAAMQERDGRLVTLDTGHFYDPQDGWVLAKPRGRYTELHRYVLGSGLSGSEVESEAPAQGFRKVMDGLYWNEAARHLYVKSGAFYTLYSIHPLPEEL